MKAPDPQSALRGASLLVSLQLLSRLVTFLGNQLLLRFITPDLLGTATQLEVFHLSVLFFAREALRVAILRQPSSKDGETAEKEKDSGSMYSQAVVNLSFLPLPLGALSGLILAKLMTRSRAENGWDTAVGVYLAAAALELFSEPAFALLQAQMRFGVRASAEAFATLARCATTLILIARGSRTVLPFAIGQFVFAAVLVLAYLIAGTRLAREGGFSLLPRRISAVSGDYLLGLFYRPTVRLAAGMTAQGLLKHFLSQGDTLLVSALSTATAQGVYAIASNYGSLLARLVFQPVEESCRAYFSRILSGIHDKPNTSSSKPNNPDTKNNTEPITQSDRTALQTAKKSLQTILHAYTLLSTLLLTIAPPLAPHLLSLIAGHRWGIHSGAGRALATYCYYIPLQALNGVTEAFVASVANEADLRRQSLWMAFFSLAFGIAGYFFLAVADLGAQGLVYANCVNMGCRIVWSMAFIRGWFSRLDSGKGELGDGWLESVIPGPLAVLGCVLGPAILNRVGGEGFGAILRMGAAGLPIVLLLLFVERKFLLECYASVRGMRNGSSEKAS